jgi:hypothetical protein
MILSYMVNNILKTNPINQKLMILHKIKTILTQIPVFRQSLKV